MLRLKNEEEIKGIRRSCQALAQVLSELKPWVKPGVTTRHLDKLAFEAIKRTGGRPAFLHYNGFPASLCISVNDEVIHGIPGDYALKPGDVASLDLGINLEGYFSDAAITLPVGEVSREVQKLLEVTQACLHRGIAQARAGNRIRDISQAVYDHARQNGFEVVRDYCGHGVGLDVHEDPQISNYPGHGPNPRIRPGMVLAIEPMINMGGYQVDLLSDGWTVRTRDRKFSAHFEHTVAVFEDRTEILTLPG
ncbi:MAG: type I methionyl aminopeptidase [Spirochaetales bacterium]|jgi:methionyl aminopeptidase|nr:type I methionyl aminopeptidase [Spirochaetales bacterium]